MAELGMAGMTSTFHEWATTETGASALGVAGGVLLADIFASMVSKWLNLSDETAKWGKLIAKGVGSFLIFFIARKTHMTGGSYALFTGASIGFLASALIDLLKKFFPSQTSRRVVVVNPQLQTQHPTASVGTTLKTI